MFYVDRIEEELVLCQDEDEHMLCIDLAKFDTPVHEGDCVVPSPVPERYIVDTAATTARRKALAQRTRCLFRKRRKQ